VVEPVWEGEDELETPWEEYRDKIKAMLQGGGAFTSMHSKLSTVFFMR